MTKLGFRTDDAFMAWERPPLIFFPSPFSIHFKVLGIFQEKLRASVKAILTGEYDTGDMEQIVKDMLYAKLLVKRWLYVGLPGEERERDPCTAERPFEKDSEIAVWLRQDSQVHERKKKLKERKGKQKRHMCVFFIFRMDCGLISLQSLLHVIFTKLNLVPNFSAISGCQLQFQLQFYLNVTKCIALPIKVRLFKVLADRLVVVQQYSSYVVFLIRFFFYLSVLVRPPIGPFAYFL